MPSSGYYTLVSGLPRLVHFAVAERLPINRHRLEQRLGLLGERDASDLGLAEALVRWRQAAVGRTDEQIVRQAAAALRRIFHPRLRRFVRTRMEQRTVLAALRRRQRGSDAPAPGEVWGVGEHTASMARNWDDPDLGLGGVFPWLAEARRQVAAGDAIALERFLMNLVWRELGRIADEEPFGFEEVFAYVFRWDILQSWLCWDAAIARTRFEEYRRELTGEYEDLFHHA